MFDDIDYRNEIKFFRVTVPIQNSLIYIQPSFSCLFNQPMRGFNSANFQAHLLGRLKQNTASRSNIEQRSLGGCGIWKFSKKPIGLPQARFSCILVFFVFQAFINSRHLKSFWAKLKFASGALINVEGSPVVSVRNFQLVRSNHLGYSPAQQFCLDAFANPASMEI